MFKPMLEIMSVLDAKEFKYRVEEREDLTALHMGINGKDTHYEIVIFATSDNNSVAMRANQLTRVPEEKRDAMLKVINERNNRYRFVKFTLDNDADVNLEWDAPDASQNIGEMCWEMTLRMLRIVNESFPEFMKCIWAS